MQPSLLLRKIQAVTPTCSDPHSQRPPTGNDPRMQWPHSSDPPQSATPTTSTPPRALVALYCEHSSCFSTHTEYINNCSLHPSSSLTFIKLRQIPRAYLLRRWGSLLCPKECLWQPLSTCLPLGVSHSYSTALPVVSNNIGLTTQISQ